MSSVGGGSHWHTLPSPPLPSLPLFPSPPSSPLRSRPLIAARGLGELKQLGCSVSVVVRALDL